MMGHRRELLRAMAGAAAVLQLPRIALAQTWPTQPVRMIVGFGPGGASDIVGRMIAQRLSEQFGRPFIVENRPGAAANIAVEAVVRAPADGHTLLLAQSGNAINVSLYQRLNFDFLRDIAPVATIAVSGGVMEVTPSFPAKTVPEFIAYAKANPGKVTMATSGNGTVTHVWGELFKMMAGVDLVAVPYRAGSSAELTDLMGGQVDVTFDPVLSSIEFVKSGKLRALAVTTPRRLAQLPEVPAVGEFVPGYEAEVWVGIGAPRRTPSDIINRLNTEIAAVLADARLKARLAELGAEAFTTSPSEFAQLIARDIEKWSKVVRAANITVD
jgi:tripartite-type tricarboxylate transporter receptor subunit TctC